MGLAEVAGAGKKAATDGGIMEVVVVFVKAVASDFEVVMGFDHKKKNRPDTKSFGTK